jgi:hypothetical protein
MWISLLGLLMLAVYIGFSRPLFRDSGKKQSHSYDYTPTVGVRAADAYTRSLIHTMQDAGKMKGEAQYGTSERDKS